MIRTSSLHAALAAGVLVCLTGCGTGEIELLEPVNPSYVKFSGAAACGSVLASWGGTNAHSNGPYTGTGSSCGGVGTYGYQYQCVELVMRHFKTNWNLSWTVSRSYPSHFRSPAPGY